MSTDTRSERDRFPRSATPLSRPAPSRPAAPARPAGPRRLVFFDVDETLIGRKSGPDFLRDHFVRTHGADGARRAGELLGALAGLPRAEANRRFHRAFRGCRAAEVEAAARRWYEEHSRADGFYLPTTLAALRRHRAEGASVALVSGTFPPLLAVIAEAVGARFALGAKLERCGPLLTGELIGPPAIGQGKRTLVRRLLARHPDIDPADCSAYGDHPSDLPMLHSVGHAVMVAPDGTHTTVAPHARGTGGDG
ncbi:HAD-IB family hydrolase [Streptomyces sp. M92]|uniref:HAD-IB family hydrolase n=1 Tax=Streptomyces sp. M92 TaxID=2944250 RepID=UPI0023492391|nr:HAD-IB family hydrolase [Streptomyces sp. M92]WCN03776.1 HAD-IB family hydrolase [Streptomyces sp. M92]